jgi:hypothetical protein
MASVGSAAALSACRIAHSPHFRKYAPRGAAETVAYWAVWESVIYAVANCSTRAFAQVVGKARDCVVAHADDIVQTIAAMKDDEVFQIREGLVRIVVALMTTQNENIRHAIEAVLSPEEIAVRITQTMSQQDPRRMLMFGMVLRAVLEWLASNPGGTRRIVEAMIAEGIEDVLEVGKERCRGVQVVQEVLDSIHEYIAGTLLAV